MIKINYSHPWIFGNKNPYIARHEGLDKVILDLRRFANLVSYFPELVAAIKAGKTFTCKGEAFSLTVEPVEIKPVYELEITEFFNGCVPSEYSASVAERGQNAGKETWQAANECEYTLLKNESERVAVRKYFKTFGAWDDKEINTWTDTELNALMIQLVSGDMREGDMHSGSTFDWEQYEKDASAGRISGRIFKGTDSKIYISISE